MVVSPDEGSFLDPKWFVIGFAFAAFALILHYDLRLGLAAGTLLGLVAALWLYLVLRFSLPGRSQPSERRLMEERFRKQVSNRSKAALHKSDDDAGSGAQSGPDTL
jgi:hypothetical protein